FPSPLHRAADAYIVSRSRRREEADANASPDRLLTSAATGQAGKTIIAGYPWFTDWGRDTFIALRGLCLATGRLADARDILLAWAPMVSAGMLPNCFPDDTTAPPQFNAVDASLWYVIAADEYLRTSDARRQRGSPEDPRVLEEAIDAILTGYTRGTRYGIHLDDDGLIAP